MTRTIFLPSVLGRDFPHRTFSIHSTWLSCMLQMAPVSWSQAAYRLAFTWDLPRVRALFGVRFFCNCLMDTIPFSEFCIFHPTVPTQTKIGKAVFTSPSVSCFLSKTFYLIFLAQCISCNPHNKIFYFSESDLMSCQWGTVLLSQSWAVKAYKAEHHILPVLSSPGLPSMPPSKLGCIRNFLWYCSICRG